jgi:hypothetical protein
LLLPWCDRVNNESSRSSCPSENPFSAEALGSSEFEARRRHDRAGDLLMTDWFERVSGSVHRRP